jgi:hypothetical protein
VDVGHDGEVRVHKRQPRHVFELFPGAVLDWDAFHPGLDAATLGRFEHFKRAHVCVSLFADPPRIPEFCHHPILSGIRDNKKPSGALRGGFGLNQQCWLLDLSLHAIAFVQHWLEDRCDLIFVEPFHRLLPKGG